MAYGVKKKEPFNALAQLPEQPARERQTKFNIVKAGTAIDRGLSIIIYGIPGAGKTTMASTLPVDQTIIISTEAGLGPLLGTGHHYFDLHFDGDGLAGSDEGVILRGARHGDLVRSFAQALERSSKTLLILIVHEHVGMDSLRALGQFVFQLKTVAELVPGFWRRNHDLRPILYWFIGCEDWCSAQIAG